MQASTVFAVGGSVAWVEGMVVQTSMGRAVGGGVSYSGVEGVVQASMCMAVGGSVTNSGMGAWWCRPPWAGP